MGNFPSSLPISGITHCISRFIPKKESPLLNHSGFAHSFSVRSLAVNHHIAFPALLLLHFSVPKTCHVNPTGTYAQTKFNLCRSLATHTRAASFNLQKHKTNRLNLRSECSHRATWQPLHCSSSSSSSQAVACFWSIFGCGLIFPAPAALDEVFNQNASAKF